MRAVIAVKQLSPAKGRGVLAVDGVASGDCVEICPIICDVQEDHCVPPLRDYAFRFQDRLLLLGGCGSFYNHSEQPNAEWEMITDSDQIMLRAVRPIAAGEEITIKYKWRWFELEE